MNVCCSFLCTHDYPPSLQGHESIRIQTRKVRLSGSAGRGYFCGFSCSTFSALTVHTLQVESRFYHKEALNEARRTGREAGKLHPTPGTHHRLDVVIKSLNILATTSGFQFCFCSDFPQRHLTALIKSAFYLLHIE